MGLLPQFIRKLFTTDSKWSKDERVVRARFERAIRTDYKKLKSAYLRRFGPVINTDSAKELSPEYGTDDGRVRFSKCVYDPAKQLVDSIYAEEVVEERWATVMFLAGGAASGKTTAVAAWKNSTKNRKGNLNSLLTVDGTLSNLTAASQQIELALETGHVVTIFYIYCPVELALFRALNRAVDLGRVLTLERFAQTHFDAQRTVLSLHETHQSNAGVEFAFMSVRENSAENTDLQNILESRYESFEAVLALANEAFKNEQYRRKVEGNPLPERIIAAFSPAGAGH